MKWIFACGCDGIEQLQVRKESELSGGYYDRNKGREERKTWDSLLRGGRNELGTFGNMQRGVVFPIPGGYVLGDGRADDGGRNFTADSGFFKTESGS